MTLAPLLSEAADSLVKASTHEPVGKPGGPGLWKHKGLQLPAYIQHIANDLKAKFKGDTSRAIATAIAIVKHPPKNWGAEARAAAAKAAAEWERLKASHGGVAEQLPVPTLADEMALREAALARVAVFSGTFGTAGLVGVLAEGALAESAAWYPTLKRAASAPQELERHDVYDGSQHVGTVARRSRGMGRDQWSAFAVNGTRVSDYETTSKPDALKALQTHLGEAPARVISWPTAGKWMVAQPSSYSGETTYRSFPNEIAARHAAGLPASPTAPEATSKVEALAERLRLDLAVLEAMDVPPLRRVQEARRRDPFELVSEAFATDELRGFHGRWVRGGGHHAGVSARAVGSDGRRPRSLGRAEARYEGGVVRASARARRELAAKPQIARATDKDPERALAAAVGSGAWDRSAAGVSKRLLAQPQMGMDEIERKVRAGQAIDTEKAHRTGPDGAYSAERQALHEHIVSLLLQGKATHEGSARAVFTAGGGAAGKSAMIKSGTVKVPADAVIANPDVVREMLPEYKALKAAEREDAASLTHEEASHITKLVTRIAMARQHHLLVDGVGDSGKGKFAGKVQAVKEAGHEVSVHYATVPTAEAIKRADERGARTGRYVDHSVLRSAHRAVSANFPDIAAIPGVHVQVFDTSSRTPRLMAEKPARDKLVIKDRSGYRGFLSKASEGR